jgi:hypothetical protein
VDREVNNVRPKGVTMPNISGSFTAHITAETTLFPEDQPNHQVQLAEIHGTQKSADPSWNNARLTYCGVTDIVSGDGKQSGYYVNEHQDGDSDRGSFEGRVTTAGGQTTIEGTFTFTSGTGKLKGIRGHGTFKGGQVSPTEIEMSWTGAYEIAATARVA